MKEVLIINKPKEINKTNLMIITEADKEAGFTMIVNALGLRGSEITQEKERLFFFFKNYCGKMKRCEFMYMINQFCCENVNKYYVFANILVHKKTIHFIDKEKFQELTNKDQINEPHYLTEFGYTQRVFEGYL